MNKLLSSKDRVSGWGPSPLDRGGPPPLKMTTAQVVETSVTVNNIIPIQDYVHPDDQTQPTFEMTPGFKPFTIFVV